MIEVVTREKFYKDVVHELLHPTVPKDPRAPHASSSTLAVAPSHSTRSGGGSSASSTNTRFLKMFRGIFAMYHCTDQRMDVME
jgi:BRCT domain type II-containing protein